MGASRLKCLFVVVLLMPSSSVMEVGDDDRIAVVDVSKISLAREVQPEASHFTEVANYLDDDLDDELTTFYVMFP